jgi:ketosteroid isomerase-like protein
MSQSDVQTVNDAYEAFARGDVPAVLAVFAEDIRWHAPDVLPHGGHVQGRDEVGTFFGRLVSTWEDFSLEILDVVDGGDKVFGRGRASGRLGGTESGYGWVHVFHFSDGKVVHFDEYVAPPEGGFPS